MFDEGQTTQNLSVGRGTLANPVLPDSVSPLNGALNEQGEQLDKLRALLHDLHDRLQPVSTPMPPEKEAQNSEPITASSQVVGQVRAQTASVKQMQKYVLAILSELEV